MSRKKTGGRSKGTPNKVTSLASQAQTAITKAASAGLTPLEYMLEVMRDEGQPVQRRDDMAKAAARYVHPRLMDSTVTVNDKREATDWTREELVAFLRDAGDGGGRTAKENRRAREPDSVH